MKDQASTPLRKKGTSQFLGSMKWALQIESCICVEHVSYTDTCTTLLRHVSDTPELYKIL